MNRLSGMKQIAGYFGYSEATILKLIQESGFPARKISGGIWESDKEMIDQWRRDQILIANGIPPKRKKGRNHART